MNSNNQIEVRDTILIGSYEGEVAVVVIHIYDSGRIKARHPNGHIMIIEPEEVLTDYGYIESDQNYIIETLIKRHRQ